MNLEYAAYLLNEQYLLNEDADGDGIKFAKKWVTKNYHLTDFGRQVDSNAMDDDGNPIQMQDRITHTIRNVRNLDDIVETARTYFGHWLGNKLGISRDTHIGVFKYLPGAVRIAITDCDWFTTHPDKEKLENLRHLYAAAFLEWRAGIDAGRTGPQRGQLYPGEFNKDFNGLSYTQLMSQLGDKIPSVKEKFAEVAAQHGTTAEEEPHQQEEEAAPTTNSPYHFELIENYNQAHSWFDYTNPTAEQNHNRFDGARWCICEFADHWRHYQGHFNTPPTVYFCWKAASKEALMEMNNHVADYDTEDPHMLPFSEYGLSLICVMVAPGNRPGDVKLLQATSRYNHCDGHGNRRFDDEWTYFGDNLCRNGGKRKLCEILGLTNAEFNRILKPMSGDSNNHRSIIEALARGDLDAAFEAADDRDYFEDYGIYRIKHNRRYNFIDKYTKKLLSPATWFTSAGEFKNGSAYVAVDNKYNLIDCNGNMVIDVNVDSFEYSSNGKYAKIGIMKEDSDEMRYNIIRTDTGRPLLRRLYKNIILSDFYGVSIPVIDEDDGLKLINANGKVVFSIPRRTDIIAYSKTMMVLRDNNVYKFIEKKQNRVIHTITGNVSSCTTCANGNIIIKNGDGKFNIIAPTGLLFDHWIDFVKKYNGGNIEFDVKEYYEYKDRNKFGFIDDKNNIFTPDVPATTNHRCDGGFVKIGDKFYNIKGEELDVGDYKKIYATANNLVLLYNSTGHDYKFYDGRNLKFIDLGEHKIDTVEGETDGLIIKDTAGKKNYILYKEMELLLPDFLPNVKKISNIGSNCYLIRYTDDEIGPRCNIFNRDFDDMLFDLEFSELHSRFDKNGVANIRCGRKNFIINSNGDVSTQLVLMEHNITGPNSELFLNEGLKTKPVNSVFENAAYLLG